MGGGGGWVAGGGRWGAIRRRVKVNIQTQRAVFCHQ